MSACVASGRTSVLCLFVIALSNCRVYLFLHVMAHTMSSALLDRWLRRRTTPVRFLPPKSSGTIEVDMTVDINAGTSRPVAKGKAKAKSKGEDAKQVFSMFKAGFSNGKAGFSIGKACFWGQSRFL